jgi:hypothetical protein
MTTPLSAVSRCTPKSLSLASLTQPLLLLVAKGANLTCVVSSRFGEKAAFLGSGRGPWTVQVIFRLEVAGWTRLSDDVGA